MRILNIVFNAEIKYQQYAKLRKFIDRDFWSNFDPGKTHKGKTSERGLFIIYELLRNLFYNSLIFNKKLQTYLRKFMLVFFRKILECSSSKYVLEIHIIVWLLQQ